MADGRTGVLETMDTTIFFYGDVTMEAAMELNQILTEVDIKAQSAAANFAHHGYKPTIELHLQSSGGSLMIAFSIIDTINRLKSHVNTYVEGGVSSAGTLITCAGDRRFIGKNSYMLIHQLQAAMEGKFSEMADTMENSKKFMEHIHKYYEDRTNLKGEVLEEMLRRDVWLDAESCLEYGLVDEIR